MIELVLLALRGFAALLGAVVLYFTWRSYRRHRSRRLAILMAAVALMIVSALAEGASLTVLDLSEDQAHLAESVVTLAAFATFLFSIVAPSPVVARRDPPPRPAPGEGAAEAPGAGP